MMRLIRADLYRILRGKMVYITLAVMVIIIAITVYAIRSSMVVGMYPGMLGEDFEDMMHGGPAIHETMDGAIAARMALDSMNNMIYVFLPLVIAVGMAAFSSGAIKNELSVGVGRAKFYLAKLTLGSVVCIAFVLMYFLLHVFMAVTIGGFGDWSNNLLTDALIALGAHMFFTVAACSVGMFLCFVTRRTAAANGLYLAFALVPIIVVGLLMIRFPSAAEYFGYDLGNQFYFFARAARLSGREIVRGIAVGLAYILVPTVAGIMLFKKAEIK